MLKQEIKYVIKSVPHTLPEQQALPVASAPPAPTQPQEGPQHSPGPLQPLCSWAVFSLKHFTTSTPPHTYTGMYAHTCIHAHVNKHAQASYMHGAGMASAVHAHRAHGKGDAYVASWDQWKVAEGTAGQL